MVFYSLIVLHTAKIYQFSYKNSAIKKMIIKITFINTETDEKHALNIIDN